MLKGQKGITLVALVVTIIVLIILAGISISLLLGQNGLLDRAKEARNIQANAEARENAMFENYLTQVNETWKNYLDPNPQA